MSKTWSTFITFGYRQWNSRFLERSTTDIAELSIRRLAKQLVVLIASLSTLSSCVIIKELLEGQEEQELRTYANEILCDTSIDFPEWKTARLADTAYPIYRPDLRDIAYFEFPVVSGDRDYPTGFMLLATGLHDHPDGGTALRAASLTRIGGQHDAIRSTKGKRIDRRAHINGTPTM